MKFNTLLTSAVTALVITASSQASTITLQGLQADGTSGPFDAATYGSATLNGSSYAQSTDTITWTLDFISDYNANGTTSLADDGYVTWTVTFTATSGTLNTFGVNGIIGAGESADIAFSLDTSNLTGNLVSATVNNTIRAYSGSALDITLADGTSVTGTDGGGSQWLHKISDWSYDGYTNGDTLSGAYTFTNNAGGNGFVRDLGFGATVVSEVATVTVPEPSSMLLLGLGVLGVTTRRKRA